MDIDVLVSESLIAGNTALKIMHTSILHDIFGQSSLGQYKNPEFLVTTAICLKAGGLEFYYKRDSDTVCFLQILRNFLELLF